MSIKTFDDAMDFLPERQNRTGGFRRMIGVIGKIAKGIDQGLTAQAHYNRLTARGMAPAEAARTVLDQDLKG